MGYCTKTLSFCLVMLGSILSSGLVTGYSTTTVRLQTTLPTVPVSGPVIPSLQTPYQPPGQ